MKFGKLQDISNVDFRLPQEPEFNQGVFEILSKEESQSKLYIGCTGWSMKEWVGTVYPKGTKAKDYLLQYAKQFNTIELNTTHYRIPSEQNIEKWYHESEADFKFCPKVLQRISHSRGIGVGSGLIMPFCDAVVQLKEKLGPCFIQLPPYFAHDRLKMLEIFLDRWYHEIPITVEVRHESWFENDDNLSDLLSLLKEYNAGIVITDVAGRRDVLHMGLTAPFSVVRFVGNGLVDTDYSRIDDWVKKLADWFKNGMQEVYFFTHEPDNILAPELAMYMLEKMNDYPEIEVRGPKIIEDSKGEQMSLF